MKIYGQLATTTWRQQIKILKCDFIGIANTYWDSKCPKKSDSILAKNWPRNNLDVEYDTQEETILAYNREMDQSYG